jgi:polysaccharide biosynthesis/export protein
MVVRHKEIPVKSETERPVEANVTRALSHALLAALLAGIVGCQSFPEKPSPPTERVPVVTMRLVPGDEISVRFLGAPDLNTEQTIRRDGNISLQLLGDVEAAGRTVPELRHLIASLAETQLQVKDVAIILRTPSPVFVTGAVRTPGRIPMRYPINVLQAISEAGGFDLREAEVRNVIVIRYVQGHRFCYSLNFERALKGEEDEGKDLFFLKPLDIVYVPQTRIARADQWIDQHFNKLLPQLNVLGVGFSTKVNDDTSIIF